MLALALVLLTSTLSVQARPDFSGTWSFDQPKSMEKPGPDGRIVLATMLGDQFVAKQDARTLTLTIKTGGETVTAAYHLDGTETRNLSPGDIPVMSKASWDGSRLVIRSTSAATEAGRPITVQTERTIWLDADGYLVIERTGTPSTMVTPSRSVYRKTS